MSIGFNMGDALRPRRVRPVDEFSFRITADVTHFTRAFRKLGRVLRDMPRTSPRIRRMHHAYRVRQLARRRRHR